MAGAKPSGGAAAGIGTAGELVYVVDVSRGVAAGVGAAGEVQAGAGVTQGSAAASRQGLKFCK